MWYVPAGMGHWGLKMKHYAFAKWSITSYNYDYIICTNFAWQVWGIKKGRKERYSIFEIPAEWMLDTIRCKPVFTTLFFIELQLTLNIPVNIVRMRVRPIKFLWLVMTHAFHFHLARNKKMLSSSFIVKNVKWLKDHIIISENLRFELY